MALTLSTIRKPVNPQIVDPSTGRMREEWSLALTQLIDQHNAAVGELSVDPAPAGAEYIVGSSNGTLTAERVATDTATIDVDLGTAAQAKFNVLEVPGIASTGITVRTAAATYTARTLTGPAAGITVSNGSGVSGNPTLALANDLAALEGLSSTGIARRTGTDTWSAGTTVSTAEIADDAVTYAKMQNISATSRILGRKTAGAGDTEECTLSEVLDFVGSAAQGDILYRDASAWARLAAGTANYFLKTGGSGASPSYAGGLVLLSSGTMTNVATLDLVLTSFTAYRGFKIFADFLPVTDAVQLRCRFSTNGGSSYDSGASDYSWVEQFSTDAAGNGVTTSGADASITFAGNIGNGTQEGVYFEGLLLNQTSTARNSRIAYQLSTRSADATPLTTASNGAGAREAAQDTDAIRFFFSSGNISAGNYAVYGIL